jgi:16S rRNA U516 pseudouridylate synthase RsuA-like enzyme
MAAQCGMQVTRLRRIQEGPLTLGDLPVGTWRYLTETEIGKLLEIHMHKK